MRGKVIGAPPQDGSSSPTSEYASPVVASDTDFEYQPDRVLISVLFIPHAPILTNT
jgi:hypothetical protein